MRFISSFSKSIIILASVVMLVIGSLVFSSPAEAVEHVIKMGPNKKPPYVFSPSEVTVQPGDTVKFIQVNSRHNVMFDTSSKKIKDRTQRKIFKKLSHRKLLKKKNDQIFITIPDNAKPDTYDFFCTPHKSSGMKGKLIVKS